MHLPQVSSSYVYSFGSYRVDKQTHPQTHTHTNKQIPLKTSHVLRYAMTLSNEVKYALLVAILYQAGNQSKLPGRPTACRATWLRRRDGEEMGRGSDRSIATCWMANTRGTQQLDNWWHRPPHRRTEPNPADPTFHTNTIRDYLGIKNLACDGMWLMLYSRHISLILMQRLLPDRVFTSGAFSLIVKWSTSFDWWRHRPTASTRHPPIPSAYTTIGASLPHFLTSIGFQAFEPLTFLHATAYYSWYCWRS